MFLVPTKHVQFEVEQGDNVQIDWVADKQCKKYSEFGQYWVFAPQPIEFLYYHFRLYFLITRLFSSKAFLPEINNKWDTIFWNIKIIRVIIPLRTILHGYRDSEEFSREQRLYRPNCKNYLNWGALPPAPPF